MTHQERRSLLKTAKDSDPIIDEALHWVRRNSGFKLKDTNKTYISPRITSEAMDCSMPMTFDHFNFCSLGCLYCFSYFFKSNNPELETLELKNADIKRMIKAIEGNPTDNRNRLFHKHFYSKKFLLHWGGMADPFCNFERSNNLGYELIETLGACNYPTLFSFKGNALLSDKYLALFEKYAEQGNFAFQISMVTNDDKLAKKVEIGVPPPSHRLKTMKILSDMGYWTILRLRPFIIGVTDETLDDLLNNSFEAGMQGISTEFFAFDVRSNEGMKARYKWLAKQIGVKDLKDYFKALSPKERGGYMRLNRYVKEPYIKKIYQFCARHDLTLGVSDPDFKELCTSGSCCALPDSYDKNPLLENWSRSQLTYHLKELRRKYHVTGEIGLLTFDGVYDEGADYLSDSEFTYDHIAVSAMCTTERQSVTYRSIINGHWNNMKSPSNPRNYFHGKLMPHSIDHKGNIVYAYNPMDYETRWSSEGIDMTL